MRKTKHSIYTSLISLLLCISMLTGTTFAWFTDVVSSNSNVIQSGKLDAQMFWSDEFISADADGWNDAENQAVFTHENWEPGYTELKYIKIHNGGSLNFKWKLTIEADGPVSDLADVIDVYYVNPATNEITSLNGLTSAGTLTKVMSEKANSTGSLTSGQSVVLAIALHMQESADNKYKNKSLCDNGFSLKLIATQETGEFDSFDDKYDSEAEWDEGTKNFSASAPIASVPIIYGALAGNITIGGENGKSAVIPEGVKVADGATSLDLAINAVDGNDNLTLGEGESAVNMDVHIHGIAADNTQPMIVNLGAVLPALLDETEVKLYHTENGTPVQMTRVASANDFSIHNQFTYDPATGEVSIYVATFSVFSAVKTSADVWDGESVAKGFASGTGTEEDPYIIETAAQLIYFRNQVDGGNTFEGKTVKLGVDIDLKNIPFDPIGFGYYKNEKVVEGIDTNTVFMGTFDGGNHTVYNLYQNGWELDPDKTNYGTYTYSTAGGGMFASVKNATIKNIAISGAEVVFECIDMGILVGYAQGECHFENIIIANSKIANYNRYTGGVVGEVSYGVDNNGDSYSHTFKNITVDSTVKVCGLWGSFGCGMGGVIGGKWGDATVKMENVISAPVMDVYNDVVSAYQWYAFRGCGMLIGHTEEPYSDGRTSGIATASFLTCENVKVYYGDWVNYTYYQFANQTDAEGNRLWYSDYPWVRAEAGEYCDAFSNIRYGIPLINGVKVTEMSEEEFNAAVTGSTKIIFDQLYGADRGMYGQAAHEGVTVIDRLGETKTIYILNDKNWENLKLHYWYRNGHDTWTNLSEDGVSMDNMELSNFENVYRLRLPAYVDGFKITADGENEVVFTLSNLEDGEVYTLGGEHHEHSYTDGGKCVCGAYETGIWQLVTDTSALNAGDQIIIAAKNSNVALGVTQNKNNRSQSAIVKNENTATIADDVQIITLEKGNADNTFAFNVGNGYLYAASSSDNYLRTETTLSDNSSWSIEIAQNSSATIKAQGDFKRNWLRYNSQSSIFSCYESGQQEVVIYKLLGGNDDTIVPHNCLEFATGASCEDNATCTKCGQTIPDTAYGHNYESVVTEATCTKGGKTTHTCSRCGDDYVTDETDALGHSFAGDTCSVCGEDKPQVGGTKTYVFNEYTAGAQYAKNEEHVLDENTTIVTTDCHFTSELRIYSSSTYNGYAIIKSINPITSIGMNAGNNKDTLVIYGSNDEGATWTKVATISVTSTSYKDYEAELTIGYTWLKLDVDGSNQVRLTSITLTTGEPCEHTNTTTTTVDATCTEAGTTTVTCNDCGVNVSTDEIAATGHVNTTTTTVDATCTEAGIQTITCDGCGETVSTEEIAALGHKDENSDNTCDTCGNTIEAVSSKTTMKYTGSTTGNMTGNNDAATVGLDAEIFSVIGNKGGTNNNCGLNKSGQIRLYGNKTDGNGSYFTVTVAEGYTIKSIKITFSNTTNNKNCQLTVDETSTTFDGSSNTWEMDINSDSFVLKNVVTGSTTQIYIASIEITYVEA